MSTTLRAIPAATESTNPFARIGWTLADAWTITLRDLQHWRQQPAPVLIGWLFQIMLVLMFGGLFGGAITTPENTTYIEFLMPGMFTLTMFFGMESTVLAVSNDVAKGVTDRFRSMPISSAAVVLGRCFADMLNSMVGLTILVLAGLAFGWRWHNSLGETALAFVLLLSLRFALLWVGIYLGLYAKGAENGTVQILVWPIGFLSNIFVDPATMPTWLGTIASLNPLSATSEAIRQLFGNISMQNESWLSQNAILITVVWVVVIIGVFLPLAAHRYRRLSK